MYRSILIGNFRRFFAPSLEFSSDNEPAGSAAIGRPLGCKRDSHNQPKTNNNKVVSGSAQGLDNQHEHTTTQHSGRPIHFSSNTSACTNVFCFLGRPMKSSYLSCVYDTHTTKSSLVSLVPTSIWIVRLRLLCRVSI